MQFTACYRKLEHGYMGKLLEWPGVITEGEDLDDCRESLIDAAAGMALVNKEGRFITLKQADEFDDYTVKELCKEAGIPDIFQTQNREDNKI